VLAQGDKPLREAPLGTLFLPYACAWYENRFALEISNELFDQLDRVSFVARADEVRAL